jgi:S-methylmethionine-dependent homocysteine/selenocysteine methylase
VTPAETLQARLAGREIVILDGGMGSELQLRGAAMDAAAWSAIANLRQPDLVQAIHEDYIRAGADVIITNTFASSRLSLAAAGEDGDTARANQNAVAAAVRAREAVGSQATVIAGSISQFQSFDAPRLGSDETRRSDNYAEQAELLAAAGVDILALEMMNDLAEAHLAVAAASAVGLPVWLGVTPQLGDDGSVRTWTRAGRGATGEDFERHLRSLLSDTIDAVTLIHSTVDAVEPALEIVERIWDGPTGVYPEVGRFQQPNWVFVEMDPGDYLTEARRWVARGVQIIGGCCGVRPAHIEALRADLPKMLAAV